MMHKLLDGALDSAQPPPSYASVFQRVRAAKQESTSNAGFAKSTLSIFVGAIFAGAGTEPTSYYNFSLFCDL